MPIALTCACGARLEIDDTFAGQSVNCPDCQRPLQTPALAPANRRTSGLALASIILALVGAFTVIGTVAAVVLGVAALIQIAARPDRVVGRGYALAGIVLGALMTTGTVLAISSLELFGLTGMMNETNWSGKLDYSGSLEISRPKEGFAIKRPSEKWGVYRPSSRVEGPNDRGVWDDLVIALPSADLTVLCYAVPAHGMQVDGCSDKTLKDLPHQDKVGLFNQTGRVFVRSPLTVVKTTRPAKRDEVAMIETQIDWRQVSEDRTFLVRVFMKDGDDRMFVVIGGARRQHFVRLESQLREAMDSFHVLPHEGRPDW
jgi:hypothetical protein